MSISKKEAHQRIVDLIIHEYGLLPSIMHNAMVDELGWILDDLVEKPEPVEVTQEEAEMLDRAKRSTFRPAYLIGISSDGTHDDEDRLTRAYVNGYVAKKPKRYYVKVPNTKNSYYYHAASTVEAGNGIFPCKRSEFTQAEIDENGLQGCEKEEVRDEK